MSQQLLQDEINKRFTLNWLIQGAAQHAGMTFHHIVRDELDALNPELLLHYDQYALINLLQYWHADAALLFGRPSKFWARAGSSPRHPFFKHPLLSKFGGILAEAGRERALERCKEKHLTRIPIAFSLQATHIIARLRILESPHRAQLIELAKRSASIIWGIPIERLTADLRKPLPFGTSIRIRNARAAFFRNATVGLGGVVQGNGSLMVVGQGTNWQLLTKELVKGTAELICMHGLSSLDENTYLRVVDAADRIEFEPWMLQTGGELWRRMLAVIPKDRSIAQLLMRMARLPANSLQALVLAVIEQPEWAKEILGALADEDREPVITESDSE
ncbi:MAG TPA: hypothetical protein VGG19_04300 [Tepidisphaeraceae bacterium]|jgi:hypothetical protein